MKVVGIRALTADLRKMQDCRVVNKAVLQLYADMDKRIFMDGLASDGSRIGTYSTKPMYMNPADSPKAFTPKGKTGKSTFKSGKPHVTRYFAGGWKEVRNTTGRRIDTVNLDFTGALKSAFVVEAVCGKNPTIGFADDLSAEKADGNESRFKKMIFDPSDAELNQLPQLIIDALEELGL